MRREPFHQPRVLKAKSNLAMNPARERAATASLGNVGQGLTTLTVKKEVGDLIIFHITADKSKNLMKQDCNTLQPWKRRVKKRSLVGLFIGNV